MLASVDEIQGQVFDYIIIGALFIKVWTCCGVTRHASRWRSKSQREHAPLYWTTDQQPLDYRSRFSVTSVRKPIDFSACFGGRRCSYWRWRSLSVYQNARELSLTWNQVVPQRRWLYLGNAEYDWGFKTVSISDYGLVKAIKQHEGNTTSRQRQNFCMA